MIFKIFILQVLILALYIFKISPLIKSYKQLFIAILVLLGVLTSVEYIYKFNENFANINKGKFKITNNLQCFLNAVDNNSFNNKDNIWLDLSNNKNKYIWINKPIINDRFGIELNDNMCNGPASDSLSISKNFTLLCHFNINNVDNDISQEEDIANKTTTHEEDIKHHSVTHEEHHNVTSEEFKKSDGISSEENIIHQGIISEETDILSLLKDKNHSGEIKLPSCNGKNCTLTYEYVGDESTNTMGTTDFSNNMLDLNNPANPANPLIANNPSSIITQENVSGPMTINKPAANPMLGTDSADLMENFVLIEEIDNNPSHNTTGSTQEYVLLNIGDAIIIKYKNNKLIIKIGNLNKTINMGYSKIPALYTIVNSEEGLIIYKNAIQIAKFEKATFTINKNNIVINPNKNINGYIKNLLMYNSALDSSDIFKIMKQLNYSVKANTSIPIEEEASSNNNNSSNNNTNNSSGNNRKNGKNNTRNNRRNNFGNNNRRNNFGNNRRNNSGNNRRNSRNRGYSRNRRNNSGNNRRNRRNRRNTGQYRGRDNQQNLGQYRGRGNNQNTGRNNTINKYNINQNQDFNYQNINKGNRNNINQNQNNINQNQNNINQNQNNINQKRNNKNKVKLINSKNKFKSKYAMMSESTRAPVAYNNYTDNILSSNDNSKSYNNFMKYDFDNSRYYNNKKNNCPKMPDMTKYIRKDKIPCWGCNLDKPNKCSKWK